MTRTRHPLPALRLTALAAATLCAASIAQAQEASASLGEVIVTAQKRSQSASKTPLSLSAITGDDLKASGITDAKGLTDTMAGVQIGGGYGAITNINIRGLGTSDASERGDPSAAFHIDGIAIGRPQGAGAAFYDIERVEVLRGPQGTLYGRNATAGAVNVITRKPKSILEAGVDVTLGNYNHKQVEGMLNVPVNDMLAFRGVVSAQAHDGYADTAHAPQNTYAHDRDDVMNFAGRVQGLLKFSPGTSLWVSADAMRDKNHGSATYLITAPYDGGISSRFVSPQIEGKRDNNGYGGAAEFKTDLGLAELTYLFGRRYLKRDELDALGNGVAGGGNNQDAKYTGHVAQNSHELRFAGNNAASPLQWVAGLYWYREANRDIDFTVNNLNTTPALAGLTFRRFQQDPTISESKAVFGQATYSLLPSLRLTAGLRYTEDTKSRLGTTTLRVAPAVTILQTNDAPAKTWQRPTYRLGVDYDLSRTTMVYANVATGFKAGGYNDGNPTNNPDNLYYNPETVTSYEGGIKGRFLNNTLQLNASAFYYDYNNFQVSSVLNNALFTFNAAKARVLGAEFEGQYRVVPAGRIKFALSLLDATYRKMMLSSGDGANNTNFAGKHLDSAPDATLSLGYTHSWNLESGAGIQAAFNTRYSGGYYFTDPGTAPTANAPGVPAHQISQSSFVKSDLSLTYNAPSDKWYAQAWIKNIENKTTIAGVFNNQGANYAYLAAPRTFGLRAGVKF